MTVNFESLLQAEKSQAIADHQRYLELLRDLAAGKDRDEADILEICRRVDRNISMLEEDVKWRTGRDKLIAEVRLTEQYETELKEADAELDKLNEEFKQVETEHEEKCCPLHCKYNRAMEQLRQIRMYRRELENDHRDQNILDELESLSEQKNWRRIQYLEEKSKELHRQISYAQQELADLPAFCPGRKERKQEIKARIKDLQVRYEKAQTEIAELERKDAEIKAREDELREAMVFA